MGAQQTMTLIPGSHPAQELKKRVLESSCYGFRTMHLTPSQRHARNQFIRAYDILNSGCELYSAHDIMTWLMGLLDQFFFFGAMTPLWKKNPGNEMDWLHLRLSEESEIESVGILGYYDNVNLRITLLTRVWGTNVPSTLDMLLGTLCHEMTHAFLGIFHDPNQSLYEEVEADELHGTVFLELCSAIQDTVRGWSPNLMSLYYDGEATWMPRDDAPFIIDNTFIPLSSIEGWDPDYAGWKDPKAGRCRKGGPRKAAKKVEFYQPSLLD
ncbi:hypothetical protein F4810DRAFT_717462 [Camillea tinctor]|nr:hypothetical protein F4810DRAFT_717462 [Camillea tinctor]